MQDPIHWIIGYIRYMAIYNFRTDQNTAIMSSHSLNKFMENRIFKENEYVSQAEQGISQYARWGRSWHREMVRDHFLVNFGNIEMYGPNAYLHHDYMRFFVG